MGRSMVMVRRHIQFGSESNFMVRDNAVGFDMKTFRLRGWPSLRQSTAG